MADDNFTLYYFPISFCSQKALVTLYEKGVNFQHKVIDLRKGAQNEPWYMKLNPNGTVPTLQHGDKIIKDSGDILRYLDREIKTEPVLLPDPESQYGKEAEYWFLKLNDLPIQKMTFGSCLHPELTVSSPNFPPEYARMFTVEGMNMSVQKGQEALQRYAEKYPECKQLYLEKLAAKKPLFTGESTSVEATKKTLDDLEQIFDEVEVRLKKTKEEQTSTDYWLLEQRFTASDIILAIFIDRMECIGISERYLDKTKRPLLRDYYQRLGSRKSVQKVRALTRGEGTNSQDN